MDDLSAAAAPAAAANPSTDLCGRRLLMVAHANSAHTGRWARYFRDRGMTVRVVSPTPEGIDGIETVHFPGRHRWYHRLKGLHLYLDYPRWRHLVARFRPDVVHVHYPDGGGRNHFYFDAVADRLVVSTWGSEVTESPQFPLSEKHKAGVRAILAKAAVVTATTRFLADVTAGYCPPGKPIHIIPFGVDCDLFKPAASDTLPAPARRSDDGDGSDGSGGSSVVRLGFFKNLQRKYGPHVLVEAFATIAGACPGARLTIAGAGEMADDLRTRVVHLGLSDKTGFPGRLPHDRMAATMREMDLVVMPSVCQESFGVAAIEASACEVPVVASRVGGVGEAVLDGVTGLLVPPDDPAALAEACLGLIRDPRRRRQLGRAGRRFVLDNYQWQRNAATMATVYGQLLAGRPVRTPNVKLA